MEHATGFHAMNQSLPRHGGQLRMIAQRFGLDPANLLDFSANINPDGPPQAAIRAMQDALRNRHCLTQYPDLEELPLRQALAEYTGVRLDQVLVANGFVPLLDAALRSLRIRSCVLPVPAFNEYRRVLEQNGIAVRPTTLHAELGFRYHFDELLGFDSDAILLANPQNPTGVLCNRATLLNFVIHAANQGKRVLLDEAFIDYLPEHSLAASVDDFPNLIVFRSLTKFFGMPGLRVAYALANAASRSAMEMYVAPWAITSLASLAATAAVKDADYIQTAISRNIAGRDFLSSGLVRLNLDRVTGAANFLLFETPDAEKIWRQLIVEHGLVLRSCDDYETLPRTFLRAAVRDEESSFRLLQAFSSQESRIRSGP